MNKICFVVQRYGLEVNGGSELYCRLLAEKMTQFYQVEVFTTCAVDYASWRNEYPSGTEMINGVKVRRFPTEKERDQRAFAAISQKVLLNQDHSDEDERRWIREQGPVCNALLKELRKQHKEYKAVIFMTYLYYLSAVGLPLKMENAILIPTLHDEPPAHLRYYQKVFESAKGFIWNAPAEERFARLQYRNIDHTDGVMAGIGIDVPSGELPPLPDALKEEQYIVYAGRIDESKGCKKMFHDFLAYRKAYKRDIRLAVMGKEVLKVPGNESIVYLGFVSDEQKFSVIRQAKALVLFSEFESLSMVVLESMIMGRPVLVNGKCEVLKDHCTCSNAGLSFYNTREFIEELEYLYTHDEVYRIMCRNGIRYVEENYQWDVIINRIHDLIERVGIKG